MEVGIFVNVSDSATDDVAEILMPIFEKLSRLLEGDYGGKIEHLWVDFELVEILGKSDGSERHPFRFQRRVSGRSRFGLSATPYRFNVGHFSVRPDFEHLLSLPVEQVASYVLFLIYKKTEVLQGKEKKLGGFNSSLFREAFKNACVDLGYRCDH